MPTIALIQGIIYIVSGLWPVFNMSSFEKVTGNKTDTWLVKTVGLLLASIGLVLILGDDAGTMKVLGIASAASLALIDFTYATIGRIPKIYLLDGLLQLGLIAGWLIS